MRCRDTSANRRTVAGATAPLPEFSSIACARSLSVRVAGKQRSQESFAPYPSRMTVGKLEGACQECHVKPVDTKLHDAIANGAFGNLDLDPRMLFPVSFEHVGEETTEDQGMDADVQAALLAARHHAGGPDGVAEMVDAGRHSLDEMPAGFCQPDAPRMALEQEDAKAVLQRLHARADAGLRHAECVRSMAAVRRRKPFFVAASA